MSYCDIITRAHSSGANILRMTSSVTRSLQFNRKLYIAEIFFNRIKRSRVNSYKCVFFLILSSQKKIILPPRAPALPSSVTCHVNASPLTFSDSSSLMDLGNAFLHSNSILGRWFFITEGPISKMIL